MRIHWLDCAKSVSADELIFADDGRLPAGTPVRLVSEHHAAPPQGYDVFELVPKFLHKLFGDKEVWATGSDAQPLAKKRSSVYWASNEWELGAPRHQASEAVFRPKVTADAADSSQPVFAALLRSSYLFIRRAAHSRDRLASLDPRVEYEGAEVALGELRASSETSELYVAEVATDPLVRVRLLQGEELVQYMEDVAVAFSEVASPTMTFVEALGADLPAYFVAELPAGELPVDHEMGPGRPLRIRVGAPATEGLRAAYAIRVESLEGEPLGTSDPAFLTDSRAGRLIRTDLSPQLLDHEARAVLASFAENDFDIDRLAQARGTSLAEAWQVVVDATEELGAQTVEDASTLVYQLGQEERQTAPSA